MHVVQSNRSMIYDSPLLFCFNVDFDDDDDVVVIVVVGLLNWTWLLFVPYDPYKII
jgi:hypothetical protein